MTKKMTPTQKRELAAKRNGEKVIRATTAQIIQKNLVTKYGDGYRIADLVNKVRELTEGFLVTQKTFLSAIQEWIDKHIIKFNNKYLMPTHQGRQKLAKQIPA